MMVTWERIESLDQDARREEEIESKFTRLHFNDATKEVDVSVLAIDASIKRKVVTDS
jgi:hypothetical protein